MKENGFKLTKEKIKRYPAQNITDADYVDDITLLANEPAQAETLLHSLERPAAGIGLYDNAHKTEYMCFNQTGEISTLNGSSLKLVDNADDITLLANEPAQAETLLHSLERPAAGIGLYDNVHETEYMCFNQTGEISTLNGIPL